MKRPPIRIRCEGSGSVPVARELAEPRGLCGACGQVVELRTSPAGMSSCVEHQRDDLVAMLERGDFG